MFRRIEIEYLTKGDSESEINMIVSLRTRSCYKLKFKMNKFE